MGVVLFKVLVLPCICEKYDPDFGGGVDVNDPANCFQTLCNVLFQVEQQL